MLLHTETWNIMPHNMVRCRERSCVVHTTPLTPAKQYRAMQLEAWKRMARNWMRGMCPGCAKRGMLRP